MLQEFLILHQGVRFTEIKSQVPIKPSQRRVMDHLREVMCVGKEADLAQAAADGGADDAE